MPVRCYGKRKDYSARHIILDYKNHKIKTKHESKKYTQYIIALRYASWLMVYQIKHYYNRANWELYTDITISNRCINTSISVGIIWSYFQTKLCVPYKLNSTLQNLNLYSCRSRLEQMNTANQSTDWITGNISISSCTMLGPYENSISDITLSYWCRNTPISEKWMW